jgi:predicted PurR-regulated permease PerM
MAAKRNNADTDNVRQPGDDDTPPLIAAREYRLMHLWEFQAVRDVLVVAAVIGLLALGYALRAVTVPLLAALLLAYLFEPLIQWMCRPDRWGLTRLRAVTMLLVIVGGTFLILLAILLPLGIAQTVRLTSSFSDGTLRRQISAITEHIPEFAREEFENLIGVIPEGRPRPQPLSSDDDDRDGEDASDAEAAEGQTGDQPVGDGEPDSESADGSGQPPVDTEDDIHTATRPPPNRDEVERMINELVDARIDERLAERAVTGPPPSNSRSSGFLSFAGSGFQALWQFVMFSFGVLMLFVLLPFYFFFLSVNWPRIVTFAGRLLPQRNRTRTLLLIHKMDRVVSAFVRGRIVICLITGVLFAIGWWICGVPYAFIIGMVTGAFFIVPYLAGVGLPVAIAFLFFDQVNDPTNNALWWFWVILWPSVVFGLVQLIETYILTPKIAGQATNLDPVTVVVAVLAGGSLLGVYGMLLAIPLAACAKILIVDVLMPRIDEWLKGERPDPLPIEPPKE